MAKSPKTEAPAATGFAIETNAAGQAPQRLGSLPDHEGFMSTARKLTVGKNFLVPFTVLSADATRVMVQRFNKKAHADKLAYRLATRQEKQGEDKVGLRIFAIEAAAAAEPSA